MFEEIFSTHTSALVFWYRLMHLPRLLRRFELKNMDLAVRTGYFRITWFSRQIIADHDHIWKSSRVDDLLLNTRNSRYDRNCGDIKFWEDQSNAPIKVQWKLIFISHITWQSNVCQMICAQIHRKERRKVQDYRWWVLWIWCLKQENKLPSTSVSCNVRSTIYTLNSNPMIHATSGRYEDYFTLEWSSRIIAEILRFQKEILPKSIWIIS